MEIIALLTALAGFAAGRMWERHLSARPRRGPRLVRHDATVYTFADIPPDYSTEWRASVTRFCALLEAVQRERQLDPWRVPSYGMMRKATGAGVPKLMVYYDCLREARVIRVTGRALTRWTAPKADRRRLITALPYRQASPPPTVPAVGTAEQSRNGGTE